MTKSKKGLWAKVAIVVCALALLSTCMLSNTFAKYTSKVTGDASATVAVWSFKANNETETFKIDLTNDADPFVDVFGNTVNDNFKEKNVVPGTYGAFQLVVDARGSEVNIDVSIAFANLNKPAHLKLFTSPTKVIDFKGDTTGMTEFDPITDSQDVTLIMNNGIIDTTTTVFFYWTWVLEPVAFTYTGTDAEIATFDNAAFMTAVIAAYELDSAWVPKVVYNAGVVTDQTKLDAYIAATIADAKAAYDKVDTDYATVLDVIIPTQAELDATPALVASTKKAIEDTYFKTENIKDSEKAKWIADNEAGATSAAGLLTYKNAAKALNVYQPQFKFDINVTGTQKTDVVNP